MFPGIAEIHVPITAVLCDYKLVEIRAETRMLALSPHDHDPDQCIALDFVEPLRKILEHRRV